MYILIIWREKYWFIPTCIVVTSEGLWMVLVYAWKIYLHFSAAKKLWGVTVFMFMVIKWHDKPLILQIIVLNNSKKSSVTIRIPATFIGHRILRWTNTSISSFFWTSSKQHTLCFYKICKKCNHILVELHYTKTICKYILGPQCLLGPSRQPSDDADPES